MVSIKHIYLFVFCVFSLNCIKAQDIHLSQFYTAQLNLNPALGGDYHGAYRLANNYSNQWGQISDPITTTTIAFDRKFIRQYDVIDAGIILIHDQLAGLQLNNKLFLSGSYRKSFNGHEIAFGAQMGMVLKSISSKDLLFPDQWDYGMGDFNPNSLAGIENNLQPNQTFLDMNIGGAWSKQFGKLIPTVGFALFHINRPKDTYFGSKEKLRIRKVLNAEAIYLMNTSFSIEPKYLLMWTTKTQNMLLGSNFKYHIKGSPVRNIFAGALFRTGFNRNQDALIPIVGIGYKNFDFGFSYDVNVSELSRNSSRKTTLELSLIYTGPIYQPKQLSIPCDRY